MLIPYDMGSFQKDLNNWLTERFLPPILYIEGGWEYWIQIDFPAWLDAKYSGQYDFRREVVGFFPKYPQARLDWLINEQSAIQTAIEIKAQTHKYRKDDFLAAVNKDVEKLSSLNGSIKKVMLAAVIDPSVYSTLVAHSFQEIARFKDDVAFLRSV